MTPLAPPMLACRETRHVCHLTRHRAADCRAQSVRVQEASQKVLETAPHTVRLAEAWHSIRSECGVNHEAEGATRALRWLVVHERPHPLHVSTHGLFTHWLREGAVWTRTSR